MGMTSNEHQSTFDVIVIGAGFAGLYALHRLRDKLGLSVKVIEMGGDVGGTWYWNRYPGARCDSDSYVYCYSFSDELLQEWDWSGRYPEQHELHAYLRHVTDRFDLRRDIQFDTRVESAAFDVPSGAWAVHTDNGETFRSTYLVTAVGLLSQRYLPTIEGLETFEGEVHHTGIWPEEGVDFAGKRVGLIGTGSSGVQAAPLIAEQATELFVFQRSPQYAIPARHETVDRQFLDDIKANYDEVWRKARWSNGGFPFEHNGKSALEVDDDERQRTYEQLWKEGGVKFLFGSYRDLLIDRRANDTVSEFIRAKIREEVDDPETAEALLPTDHPFGSRRPIVHTNYYATFNRENVTLVDVRHFPIKRIVPGGIRTENAEYDLDIIVFATGFDAVTGAYTAMDIRGTDGRSLREKWVHGASSYLGLATAGFPNMFMVQGPGSTFGNQPVAIEHHVEWIANCIEVMRREKKTYIEATEEAEASWTDQVRDAAAETVVSLADSWWNGANIPGKPRSVVFYPGSFGRYRRTCDQVALDDYAGFVLTDRSPTAV
jgi:cation diffusion facilitator CzcD-associated flavoprotein CzcO